MLAVSLPGVLRELPRPRSTWERQPGLSGVGKGEMTEFWGAAPYPCQENGAWVTSRRHLGTEADKLHPGYICQGRQPGDQGWHMGQQPLARVSMTL